MSLFRTQAPLLVTCGTQNRPLQDGISPAADQADDLQLVAVGKLGLCILSVRHDLAIALHCQCSARYVQLSHRCLYHTAQATTHNKHSITPIIF